MPMLVFEGYYESADWLTPDSYPDQECYEVDETTELAAKVRQLTPCFTLVVVDGVLIDVEPREKTPEEIEAEQPVKTPEQLRIEQLETENAMMALEVADAAIRLDQSEQAQADLTLTLVQKGVL